MKVVSQTKEENIFWWKEKEKSNSHLDNSDSENINNLDDEQVNICLIAYKKVEVKVEIKKRCLMMFFKIVMWFLFSAKGIKKNIKYPCVKTLRLRNQMKF